MMRPPSVSSIVDMYRFLSGIGIHVINMNTHFRRDKSPPVWRRRCSQDCKTWVIICRSCLIGVFLVRLHNIELSSM